MFFDTYDTPVFRPPSEARSFILRVTRGCAHNKCTYCNMYRGKACFACCNSIGLLDFCVRIGACRSSDLQYVLGL